MYCVTERNNQEQEHGGHAVPHHPVGLHRHLHVAAVRHHSQEQVPTREYHDTFV